MLPSADGIHGFGRVQVAFYAYVALTLGTTAGLWWLGLPTDLVVFAFVAVGLVLLLPFRSVFADQHPEHDENRG